MIIELVLAAMRLLTRLAELSKAVHELRKLRGKGDEIHGRARHRPRHLEK